MIRITINIRPTSNNIANEAKNRDDSKKRRLTVIATWSGLIAAVIACISDALDILQRLGIL